jgi:hypothetical protein
MLESIWTERDSAKVPGDDNQHVAYVLESGESEGVDTTMSIRLD